MWLENYFDDYADKSPNGLDSRLSVASKKQLYADYVREQNKLGIPVVLLPLFYDLWNTVLPFCQLRPWINIPGKCNTCYEIDSLRKSCKDKNVLKALKELHILHRGGMFMPERAR